MAGNFSFLDGMVRLWKQKRFWLIAGMGGLLFFGYLSISLREDSLALNGVSPDVLVQDKEPPTVVIESPEQGIWMSRDFQVLVFEEDLETAIAMDSCVFQVCAYGANDEERCTGVIQRVCGEKTPAVTVGPEGMCSFEGREACFVYVDAKDVAGNKGGAYRSYHVDFTPPSIGEASIQEEGEGYAIQAKTQDNTAIATCGLYVNERFVAIMEFQQDCRETCSVFKSFELSEIESRLFIRCDDIAGNSSNGDEFVILQNQAPNVVSCGVNPTQGTLETIFQFSLKALDPNQDLLSYRWETGDGTMLNDKDAIHQYTTSGTYMPKVTVSDTEGLFAECNTAWVVVE